MLLYFLYTMILVWFVLLKNAVRPGGFPNINGTGKGTMIIHQRILHIDCFHRSEKAVAARRYIWERQT